MSSDNTLLFSNLTIQQQQSIHSSIKLIATQIKIGHPVSLSKKSNQITHCKTPRHVKHLLQLRQRYQNYLKDNRKILELNRISQNSTIESDKSLFITALQEQQHSNNQDELINDSVVPNAYTDTIVDVDYQNDISKRQRSFKEKESDCLILPSASERDSKSHSRFSNEQSGIEQNPMLRLDESIVEEMTDDSLMNDSFIQDKTIPNQKSVVYEDSIETVNKTPTDDIQFKKTPSISIQKSINKPSISTPSNLEPDLQSQVSQEITVNSFESESEFKSNELIKSFALLQDPSCSSSGDDGISGIEAFLNHDVGLHTSKL